MIIGTLSFLGAVGANVVNKYRKGKLNMSKAELHHLALLSAVTSSTTTPDEQTILPRYY